MDHSEGCQWPVQKSWTKLWPSSPIHNNDAQRRTCFSASNSSCRWKGTMMGIEFAWCLAISAPLGTSHPSSPPSCSASWSSNLRPSFFSNMPLNSPWPSRWRLPCSQCRSTSTRGHCGRRAARSSLLGPRWTGSLRWTAPVWSGSWRRWRRWRCRCGDSDRSRYESTHLRQVLWTQRRRSQWMYWMLTASLLGCQILSLSLTAACRQRAPSRWVCRRRRISE